VRFLFWDALALRSAQQAGGRVLWSKDFQEGREIDGIQFVNRFRETDRLLD
jgi:predicted nucleic acid-binding protein